MVGGTRAYVYSWEPGVKSTGGWSSQQMSCTAKSAVLLFSPIIRDETLLFLTYAKIESLN